MSSMIESASCIEAKEEINYSFILGIKEFCFLAMIFFFGFSGFSLCVEKIFTHQQPQKIESITVHDYSISHIKEVDIQLIR